MTNFDAIEAYIQDFTVWKKYDGKVIISNNKAIVKANTPFSGNWIISNNKKFEIGKIKVTGLDGNIGNNFLSYSYYNKDGNRIIIQIKKDGIYEFPNNEYDAEAGFHCNSSLTFSNDIIIEQLPTSILKDFSGNRHDAYLYGFKGKLNSGVGIYAQDFKNWNYGSAINSNISTKSYNKFHIVKKKADNWFGFTIGIPKNNYYNQSYKLKFNINKKIDDIKFNIVSTDGNLITTGAYSVYINDGSIIDVPIISEEIFNNKEETNIYYDFGTNKDIEIDVELIANYPN